MKTLVKKEKRKRSNIILEKVCSTNKGILKAYPQREVKVDKVRIEKVEINYTTPKYIEDSVKFKKTITEKLNIELAAFRNKRMQEIKEFALLFDYKLNLSTINEGEF